MPPQLYVYFGFIGAAISLLHFLFHLFRVMVQKKKIKGSHADKVGFTLSLAFMILYAIMKNDMPFIIFFAVVFAWALLGFVDKTKKTKGR